MIHQLDSKKNLEFVKKAKEVNALIKENSYLLALNRAMIHQQKENKIEPDKEYVANIEKVFNKNISRLSILLKT